MNYQDTSGALGSSGIDARNDADTIPMGDRGPAVGNVITGTGTVSGAAGADAVANGPAQVVELQGAGGIATGGGLQVAGQFGMLSMSAEGDFRYAPNADGINAEFALVVADAWQGKGLGSALLERLCACAKEAGYEALYGHILEANHDMLALAARLGFHEVSRTAAEVTVKRVL